MDWTIQAQELLFQNDYEKLACLYEGLLEEDPQSLENYWYLGLAYLLQGKETEAQSIWFCPFLEATEEQIAIYTSELTSVLQREAQRQLEKKQHQLCWQIRLAIKQINPTEINNLLELVSLSIYLKNFKIDYLEEWGIISLLKKQKYQPEQRDLLWEVAEQIIQLPTKLSIDFIEACLIFTSIDSFFWERIKVFTNRMGIEQKYITYAIDLFQCCLKICPNDLSIYRDLFAYYMKIMDYENAIKIGKELCSKSQGLAQRLVSDNLLLNCYLNIGDWSNIIAMIDQENQLLNEIINTNPSIADSLSKEAFITSVMNILYWQDDLKKNRYLINGISKIFQEHNQGGESLTYTNTKEVRPLKIGYIGHTFRIHSVGILSRWLIAYHDKNNFKINLYLTQDDSNDFTEKWFKPFVHNFFSCDRDINSLVSKIQQDQIDILVDVDSLTFNLTCLAMTRKPAPIQVTWLGLDASGLPAIDYFIADPYVLPSYAEDYYREKIWRLPQTYLAIDGFEVGVPTLTREDLELTVDSVVFLNVQNPSKLNPDILNLQMAIIKNIPDSYLLFKIRKDQNYLQKWIREMGEKNNLDWSRFRFLPFDKTVEEHRANLQIADVFLDTYPYNGATTTLEALWVGLPVITRVGEQFAARNSYTFMINAGISEGIAWSDEEYIEWGIKLGTDENLRKEVSWKLRQSRQNAPLWNAKQFTREMENAYQKMWEIYLKENQ